MSRKSAAIGYVVGFASVAACLGFNLAASPVAPTTSTSTSTFSRPKVIRNLLPSRGRRAPIGERSAPPSQTPTTTTTTTTQLTFALNEQDLTSVVPSAPPTATSSSSTSSASGVTSATASSAATKAERRISKHRLSARRRDWADRSLAYYTTVSRQDLRRSRGQLPPPSTESASDKRRNLDMAQRHYFALTKIKMGRLDHAERIYRRTIEEIRREAAANEHGGCDNARLAVSTLLLALLLQRRGDVKATRSVFLRFFKTAILDNDKEDHDSDGEMTKKECACSAKVLQAYALFEMKRGHGRKSLEIVEEAVRLDGTLRPVLEWKQFREVMGQLGR